MSVSGFENGIFSVGNQRSQWKAQVTLQGVSTACVAKTNSLGRVTMPLDALSFEVMKPASNSVNVHSFDCIPFSIASRVCCVVSCFCLPLEQSSP